MSQTRPSPRLAKSQPRVTRDASARAANASRAAAAQQPTIASRIGARMPGPTFGGPAGAYFREVRSELRKVVWPSREDAVKLTAVVIGLSFILGLYLGALDFIFSEAVRLILSAAAGA